MEEGFASTFLVGPADGLRIDKGEGQYALPPPQAMEPATIEDKDEDWSWTTEPDTNWIAIPGARDADARRALAWALGGVSVAPSILLTAARGGEVRVPASLDRQEWPEFLLPRRSS